MSYDLKIAAYNKIEQGQLQEFLATKELVINSGSIERNNLIISSEKKSSMDKMIMDIIPVINVEDIDEIFASVVLSPKWIYNIIIPESSSKSCIKKGMDLSKFIAEVCSGAAYDTREDKIIYPKGKPKRYEVSGIDERINVINMKWFIPLSKVDANIIKIFLENLKRICPEVMPEKYGDYEPLKNRLEKGEGHRFIDYLMGKKEEGQSIYFKGKKPCFSGSFDFPYEGFNKIKPDKAGCISSIKLSFDYGACEYDARWIEVFITLFEKLSVKLNAVYAMAYVEENVIVKKNGNLYYDSKCKDYLIPSYNWWIGIPKPPMWLSWFGKPYIKQLEKYLKNYTYSKYEEGLYLVASPKPVIKEELEALFPKLPQQLLAHREIIKKVISHNSDGSEVVFWDHQDFVAECVPEII